MIPIFSRILCSYIILLFFYGMRQVEVKAKVTDLDGLKNKLVLLGYFFSPALFQQDRLYLPNAFAFPDIRE